jgi:TorA maturation chaperone TorD
VLELYDEEELGIPADFKESEDHIAIELLFMFHLAKKCADELDENNDDEADALMGLQHHFLNEHLMQWAPNFAGAVIDMCEAKNLLLYDAIAYLVRGFLVYDKGFMDMILADEEEG